MKKEILENQKGIPYALALVGLLIGIIVTVASMFIFSMIIYFLNLDRAFALPFSTVSVSLGAFFSAFFTAKKMKKRGYIAGLAVGILTFVIVTVISLIVSKNGFSLNTLFHFIIIILSSVIGGILGVNSALNKKYI